MSQNCWAHQVLIKAKRQDKKRAKKRVKRQDIRQTRSLNKVAVASAKSPADTSTTESTSQN
jgi:hypothetical protein